MPRPTIMLAAIAVTYTMVGLAGCASAPKLADTSGSGKSRASSGLSALLSGKKEASQSSAFDKSYAELQSDFSGMGIVSPRIGYAAPKPAPTGLKKWTTAVAGSSMVTSIKTAFASKDKAAPTRGTSKKSFDLFSKKSDADVGGNVSVFAESSIGPDIYVVMARRAEASSEWNKAAENYRNALDVEEHHLLATTGLGRLLDRQGKRDEAHDLFVDATKHHPKAASAWNDLGTFHAQHQHNREAIRAMERAVSLDPQRDLYRNNLAMFLVEAGQPKQALAHLQAIHSPAVAHYSLGYLLKEQGHPAEALTYFRAAYQQDPQFEEARQAIEMLASQSSPAFGPHSPRAPGAAIASQSASPTRLQNGRPGYTRTENPVHENPVHEYAGRDYTGPESVPSGRVARHGDTDEEVITRLRMQQHGQRPLGAVTLQEPGNATQSRASNGVPFTALRDDVEVSDESDPYMNTGGGNIYEADSAEVQSLARQFAPADDGVSARDTYADSASSFEHDDPLSRALRQAVEEGDASVRRSRY